MTAPRTRLAAASLLGAAALTGCAAQAEGPAAGGPYTDGTYTAEGSYSTPETVETVEVTLTIADDIVTDVEVTGTPQRPESQQYQSQFIGGIAGEVVGVPLDEISVSRVAGSSLTSGGFMAAVEQIRTDAAE